jgi:hypothetical protein
MKIEKKATKTQPFGAHFTTKLEAVNNKLVCALSSGTTCTDDYYTPPPQPPCGDRFCNDAPIGVETP